MRRVVWILWLAGWLPGLAAAQGSIRGTVADSLTGQPLPFASVFLAGTTRGATADEQGRFVLTGIPAGRFDLTASALGYATQQQAVVLGPPGPAELTETLRLRPAAQALGEVVVRPNPNRAADYGRFLELWLGRSTLARQCRVRDPDAVRVDFDPTLNRLTATVPQRLEVDNPALGYRLTFYDFRFQADFADEGARLTTLSRIAFAELPGSAGQQRRRAARRRAAYEGSLMHFLRTVRRGQVGAAGYELYRLRRLPNRHRAAAEDFLRTLRASGRPFSERSVPDSIWQHLKQPRELSLLYRPALAPDSIRREANGTVALSFRDLLLVRYGRERPDAYFRLPAPFGTPPAPAPRYQESVLQLAHPPTAALDANGVLLDPLAVYVEGYWAFEAVGELLPLDYEPEP